MSSIKRVIIVSLVLLTTLMIMQGCTSEDPVRKEVEIKEENEYNKLIEDFIIALDDGDAIKLKAMFSAKAQKEDLEIDDEINYLISMYPGITNIRGVYAGEVELNNTFDGEKGKASIHTRFPISINGDYYWLDFILTYRDDIDGTNIGINRLTILNKDEMYSFETDSSKLTVDGTEGLNLLIDKKTGFDIRCIEGHPYMYNESMPLDIEEVRMHLNKSLKYSDFVKIFGEANAKDRLYIYQLPDENGETRYLSIMLIGSTDEINTVRIVDDFGWKESIIGS